MKLKNIILGLLVVSSFMGGGSSVAQTGNFKKVRVKDSITSLTNNTDLILRGAGTGNVNIEGAYTLPNTDGGNGEALVTDGNGVLSFGVAGGGKNTGVEYGGEISINGSGITVDFTAGEGELYDDTDPQSPVFTSLSWTAKTAVVPVDESVTYFYFDDNSDVIKQTTTEPTREDIRHRIYLARASMTGGVVVGVTQQRIFARQFPAQMSEISEALGKVKVDGLILNPNGVNLNIDRTSGNLFDFGSNGYQSPNIKELIAVTAPNFFRATRDALESITNVVDPNQWDDGGVLTSVSNNKWTIQDVYLFSSGFHLISYGQAEYNSASIAQNAIATRSLVPPINSELGIRIAFLIVKKGATDLSDPLQAVFIQANKFGDVGGGAVSSGGGTPDLQQVTDAGNTTTNGATFGGLLKANNSFSLGDAISLSVSGTTLDISGGGSNFIVDTDGGAALSTISTITGQAVDGTIIRIRTTSNLRDLAFNSSGNLTINISGATVTLLTRSYNLIFFYDAGLGRWINTNYNP